MRFTPGPGVGGHCLPVDPSYLSWSVRRRSGHAFRFVELANDVNEHMPDYVVRRLFSALNDQGKPIKGSRILLLGVSFKANVGDWRESPSHRVADLLVELGADLHAADPHVAPDRFPPGTTPVECTPEELAGADAVVLLVDHAAFEAETILANARYVLDTKANLPTAANVERL
jgi:nucleotide sugar dehydrogenase